MKIDVETKFPYSVYREVEDLVFISGQLPIDSQKGDFMEDDIVTQTKNSLQNLNSVLQQAGLCMDDVVKTTVFMTDMSEFMQMNEVYARFFNPPYPARSAFGVKELPKGAKIEIEAIAYKG